MLIYQRVYVKISRFPDRLTKVHQELSDELDEKVKFVSWMHRNAREMRHVEVNCVFFFLDGASFWENAGVLTFDPAHHNCHNIIIYHTFRPSSHLQYPSMKSVKTTKPARLFARESRCWASWYAFRNEPRSRTP